MGCEMLSTTSARLAAGRVNHALRSYLRDESGGITIFTVLIFVMMLMVGGIAVDVMRFEMRRVSLQQTLDRAVLAASSMQQKTRTPQQIASEWFTVAGLGDEFTVDYAAPILSGTSSNNARTATVTSKVRSYNHFMGMLDIPFFEAPVVAAAAEGISKVEVMLVLDITGSMNDPAVSGEETTKIAALRTAADSFVTIVKGADSKNGVSIGLVPYASQVNIPASLREKYSVTNVSSWNFIANQGVPDINCIEIPTSTYDSVGLSTSSPMPMAAVADTYYGNRDGLAETTLPSSSNYLPAADYPPSIQFGPRICTGVADNPDTKDDPDTPDINENVDESLFNQVMLPTKDAATVKGRINQLTADGNTSIALGMRWGTALIDETADEIYTMTDSDGKIRPFANDDETVRKIIILMTDGSHVANRYIKDAYKSGPSPFWRGTDGKYAMNLGTYRGPFVGSGALPHSDCSGWVLSTTREYFIPHLKRTSVKRKRSSDTVEGVGTGTAYTGACDPYAWKATPTWPALDASGNAILDAGGNPVMVTSQRLDWSEVWRYLRLEYITSQLNGRANIINGPSASTLRDEMRGIYIDASSMDSYLQENCKAARDAGIEIYGIAFAAPDAGKTQIEGCASPAVVNPDTSVTKYYFDATNDADLQAAFNTIASDITELRLTQ
jgi:Flp pilus assembly protein TadG